MISSQYKRVQEKTIHVLFHVLCDIKNQKLPRFSRFKGSKKIKIIKKNLGEDIQIRLLYTS